MPINRGVFFDAVRASLFGGSMNSGQVSGQNTILHEWDARRLTDTRQLAYVLATAFHETGRTMQPVREAFADSDAEAIRKLDNAFRAGKLPWVSKPYWRQGFFGRGLAQLTHVENYRKMGDRLGIDIIADRNLALDPQIAAQILIVGMTEGLFTGKKLADYINTDKREYVNARRIVNGTDRAELIAGYAEQFEEALRAAEKASGARSWDRVVDRQPDDPGVTEPPQPRATGSLIGWLVTAVVTAGAGIAGWWAGLW